MSEVLLDRIDFYEDFENDKSSWIEELRTDREKLQDKIDRAIEYIENGELYDVDDNCINEILLDILKSSDDDDNS